MKKIIKAILPAGLLTYYRRMKQRPAEYKKSESSFLGKSVKDTFTEIYKTNHWGSEDSISGSGSDNIQTATIIRELRPLFDKVGITSVLDIPCGDFNWMHRVNLSGIDYLGGDIVEDLVNADMKKFSAPNIHFTVLDLLKDALPAKDLVLTRDCFVHLCEADIMNAIKNLKRSGCTYLLTTTFPKHHTNKDIVTGDWRTLDLTRPPFNFPSPILLLNENCTEFNGEYLDKSLGLWKIADIPMPA